MPEKILHFYPVPVTELAVHRKMVLKYYSFIRNDEK